MKKVFSGLFYFIVLSGFFSCNNEDVDCIEIIQDDCMCIMIYEPVCGCNGKTYGNSCVAECSGITEFTMGACE